MTDHSSTLLWAIGKQAEAWSIIISADAIRRAEDDRLRRTCLFADGASESCYAVVSSHNVILSRKVRSKLR